MRKYSLFLFMSYINNMELILIKQDSPEWLYMWDWIFNHPINEGLTLPQVNTWQYRGSLRQDDKVLHQFLRGRKSLVLACSSAMTSDDIFKVITLK